MTQLAKQRFFYEDLRKVLAENPKKVWSIINPTLRTADSQDHSLSSAVTAPTFNAHFGDIFTQKTFPVPPLPSFERPTDMQDVYLSIVGILNVINRLPLNFSPGCDRINSTFENDKRYIH